MDNGGDPTKVWDQFAAWVQQQCGDGRVGELHLGDAAVRALARQVADALRRRARGGAARAAHRRPRTDPVVDGDLAVRDSAKWNLGNKALTALRGGYIGMLMFGMLGTVVGLALINPFSLGAGVLLGGKAISDERRRIIARRQAEAKAAVRRYVDEVAFQVGKESREMLRAVQRDLRDHYSQLADQLAASIKDSVASAERSVRTTQAEREQRLEEIPQELSALGALRDQVRTLLTMPAPSLESTMMFRAIAAPSSEPGLTTDLVPVVGHVDPAAPVPAPRARNEPPRDVPRTGGSHALRSADGRA